MKRTRCIALLALVLASCATPHTEPVSNQSLQTEAEFGFSARHFDSLDALPDVVRRGAIACLRERAGDFYPRLAFAGAQYRIYQAQSGQVNPVQAPVYIVEFRFSDRPAGIAEYAVQVHVAPDGHLVGQPNLPDFRAAPDKMHFATPESVLATARGEGYRLHSASKRLEYHRKSDSIVWTFAQPKTRAPSELEILMVSAHTAQVVGRETGYVISTD
jgi:hypothetical protein